MTDTETAPQGFGYDPIDISPYFLLTIPREETGQVSLYRCSDRPQLQSESHSDSDSDSSCNGSEDDREDTEDEDDVPTPHAQAPVSHWNLVESRLRTYFNQRLRKVQLPTGFWRYGENPLADHFGRELAILLWALSAAEESETTLIYTNWRKLQPEERRWLYARVVSAGRPLQISEPDPEADPGAVERQRRPPGRPGLRPRLQCLRRLLG